MKKPSFCRILFIYLFVGVSFSAHAASTHQIKLVDRFLISSIFTEIFGPTAIELTRADIFNKPHVFGGACDLYEQVRLVDSDDQAADPQTLCPGGRGAFAAKLQGTPNILRVAHVTRACHKLTTNEKALQYALKNVYGLGSVELPDIEKIKIAYRLFNPGKEPVYDVLNALVSINNSNQKSEAKKNWQAVFYTLCVDPTWQIL